MDNGRLMAYRSPMDYPTVRVRIDDGTTTAEVDITPKPDPETLVTSSQPEHAPDQPPSQGLPSWMLTAG